MPIIASTSKGPERQRRAVTEMNGTPPENLRAMPASAPDEHDEVRQHGQPDRQRTALSRRGAQPARDAAGTAGGEHRERRYPGLPGAGHQFPEVARGRVRR